MKLLISLLLLGGALCLAMRTSTHALDIPDLFAVLFSAGLVAWVVEIYSRVRRPLFPARPVHLPFAGSTTKGSETVRYRKAA